MSRGVRSRRRPLQPFNGHRRPRRRWSRQGITYGHASRAPATAFMAMSRGTSSGAERRGVAAALRQGGRDEAPGAPPTPGAAIASCNETSRCLHRRCRVVISTTCSIEPSRRTAASPRSRTPSLAQRPASRRRRDREFSSEQRPDPARCRQCRPRSGSTSEERVPGLPDSPEQPPIGRRVRRGGRLRVRGARTAAAASQEEEQPASSLVRQ
ncbi:hypothetical protein ACRAWF_34860 [Streptomyces sp. L7]